MATPSKDPAPKEADAEAQEGEGAEAAEGAEAKKPARAGALKTWLPLIATVVAMPALAYATTQFILLPKIKHAMVQAAAESPAQAADATGKPAGTGAKLGKDKVLVPLPKILVNVSGTMMTRYLMTSMTLVGNTSDFKDKIEENQAQLLDVARGALEIKSIADLEKPGARNQMRSELLTVFNNALGGPVVQDLYITEQAVQ